YSIQDYIDLHGLFEHEAEPVLRRFIRESARRGCQAVLVIHGRGLKSPDKPVLKGKVFDWLTRGPLRAYVMALASARACDGAPSAKSSAILLPILEADPVHESKFKINACIN
ncbi:MAG: Smr/MutS family protein, partial [Desulfobacteraceae bacterium]